MSGSAGVALLLLLDLPDLVEAVDLDRRRAVDDPVVDRLYLFVTREDLEGSLKPGARLAQW